MEQCESQQTSPKEHLWFRGSLSLVGLQQPASIPIGKVVPGGVFQVWPPWFEEPWYNVPVFYLTRVTKRKHDSLLSYLKELMEDVIKTDTMKTSILDIVTLYYPNFFIQKFPNSLGLGQLICNFHLKTSASFFFPFHRIHIPSLFKPLPNRWFIPKTLLSS